MSKIVISDLLSIAEEDKAELAAKLVIAEEEKADRLIKTRVNTSGVNPTRMD
jgi:hypothetical protein